MQKHKRRIGELGISFLMGTEGNIGGMGCRQAQRETCCCSGWPPTRDVKTKWEIAETRQLVRPFQHDRIVIDCPSLPQPCSLKPADLLDFASLFINGRKQCSGFAVILIFAFTYKATLPPNHPIPRFVILTGDLLLV